MMKKSPTMPLVVFFDESCGICKKVKKVLSRLSYHQPCDFKFAEEMNYDQSLDVMRERYYDLYSFDGHSFYKGYDTYMQVFKRSRLLLAVYWFMKLQPVRWIGEKIYRRIANARACKLNLNNKIKIKSK